MLKTFAAIVAVSAMLQVVSAAYKVLVTCGTADVKLDLNYLTTDPAMSVTFVSGNLGVTGCETTTVIGSDDSDSVAEMSLTVNAGTCGDGPKTGTGAETLTLTLFAAVNADARNTKSGDIQTFAISCQYQDGNLIGESTGTVTVNGIPDLATGAVERTEPVIGTVKAFLASDGTTEITTAQAVGTGIIVKTDISGLTALTGKCICSKVVMKATASATAFYLATDDRCSKMESATSNVEVAVSAGAASGVTGKGLKLSLMEVQSDTNPQPVTIEMTVRCCSGGTQCDTRTDCASFRKKRSAYDERGVTVLKANTTVTIVEERPQRQGQEACAGYTSNTVFYVVVVVLAVLLVITIGVAAYFGTRARVVVASKDNPVYG